MRDILNGERFALCDCTAEDISALDDLCQQNNYVVLVYPYTDSSGRFSAYFTPERRKAPRNSPVEADDELGLSDHE